MKLAEIQLAIQKYAEAEMIPAAKSDLQKVLTYAGLVILNNRLPQIEAQFAALAQKAGIMDGFLVLVNPAEPVYDGDSALVEYGIDRNIAIKRVYWLADGAVKIASADDSGWARTFTREEINEEKIFHIIGKIMFAGVRPKRG